MSRRLKKIVSLVRSDIDPHRREMFESATAASYDKVAAQYEPKKRARVRNVVQQICKGYSSTIDILDFGCGTGSMFPALVNANRVFAVDISSDMLALAKEAAAQSETPFEEVEFIQAGLFTDKIQLGTFDVVISIGTVGGGSCFPLSVTICDWFYSLLKPGGMAFVTVSALDYQLESYSGILMRISRYLPESVARIVRHYCGCFASSQVEIERMFHQSSVKQFELERHEPYWFEVVVTKPTVT